jgi:chemotaxis signal transduction protein
MSDLAQHAAGATDGLAPPGPAPIGLVTFLVGGVEYGVPVAAVHEVVPVEAITRVPAAPPHLRGLTTHRGRMIPVIDLATVLTGTRLAAIGPHARMVAVELGARIVGLLVDRTAAVVSVPAVAAEPAPRHRAVAWCVSWQGREVQVLDVDRLLEAP